MPTLPTGITRESGTIYDILKIDLAIARTNVEVEIIGDVISVVEITGTLDVRLNEKDEPLIELDKVSRTRIIPQKFTKLFFTNTAQPGKSATLYIGREASFIIDPKIVGTVGILDAADARINPAKEDGNLANLDIRLTELEKRLRWGEDIAEPSWTIGDEVTAPPAGTDLVSTTVGTGVSGRIFGIHIVANEANEFKLIWTSGGVTKSLRFAIPSASSIYIVSQTPMNKGYLADSGTTVSIQNVNAGSAGIVYQASLLYAEA